MTYLLGLFLIPIFAICHAYMGKVFALPIYPKYGRDDVAFLGMAAAVMLLLGLPLWAALVYLVCFELYLRPNPAKRVPWGDDGHWFPNGRYEPVKRTLVTLACRFGGVLAIPLAVANGYFFGVLAGVVTLPLLAVAFPLGYWLGTKFWDKGDKAGKVATGALFGLAMAIAGVV